MFRVKKFSNGNHQICHPLHPPERLSGFCGHQRCLLACAHLSHYWFFMIYLEDITQAVNGPALWPWVFTKVLAPVLSPLHSQHLYYWILRQPSVKGIAGKGSVVQHVLILQLLQRWTSNFRFCCWNWFLAWSIWVGSCTCPRSEFFFSWRSFRLLRSKLLSAGVIQLNSAWQS